MPAKKAHGRHNKSTHGKKNQAPGHGGGNSGKNHKSHGHSGDHGKSNQAPGHGGDCPGHSRDQHGNSGHGGHHDNDHHDNGHHDNGHHDNGHHDNGHHDNGHHDNGHHDNGHHGGCHHDNGHHHGCHHDDGHHSDDDDHGKHTRDVPISTIETPLGLPTTLPGAPDASGVNLSTGQVSLNRHLFSLSAGPDLSYGLSLSYSSTTAESSSIWNLDAKSGTLGTGWSHNMSQVIRMADSTASVARYAVRLDGVFSWLKHVGNEGVGDLREEVYVTQPHKFWKIRKKPNADEWYVITDSGIKYQFGLDVKSRERSVHFGNFFNNTPATISARVDESDESGHTSTIGHSEQQQQMTVVWNLSRVEDQWGNKISLSYEQDEEFQGSSDAATRQQFTRACRLLAIQSSNNRSIHLNYAVKDTEDHPGVVDKNEVPRPHTPAAQTCLMLRGTIALASVANGVRLTVSIRGANKSPFSNGLERPTSGDSRYWTRDYDSQTLVGGGTIPFEQDISDLPFWGSPKSVEVTISLVFLGSGMHPTGGSYEHTFNGMYPNSGSASYADSSAAVMCDILHLKLANDGPNGYQDRYEDHYLSTVTLKDEHSTVVEQVTLGYSKSLLEGGLSTKRLLTSITRTGPASTLTLSPPEQFGYYGVSDGLSVQQPFDDTTGGLYGALKSWTNGDQAKIMYEYGAVVAKNSVLDMSLSVSEPSGESWDAHNPVTYHGPNYVVVVYFGSHHKVLVKVLTWVGWWSTFTIDDLNIKKENLSVNLGSHFFVIHGLEHNKVLLVGQNQQNAVEWVPHEKEAGRSAIGLDFITIWHKSGLNIWTVKHDGTLYDAADDDWAVTYADSDETRGIVAQGDTIMVLRVREYHMTSAHGHTTLHFMRRDSQHQWSHVCTAGPKFAWPGNAFEHTYDNINMQMAFGLGFIGVYLSFSGNSPGCYDILWAYRFAQDGTLYPPDLLKPWTSRASSILQNISFAVVAQAIHVDYFDDGALGSTTPSYKEVYRFIGTGWNISRIGEEWSIEHRVLSPDLCTMSRDGHSHLYVFSLDTMRWEARSNADNCNEIPAWKDGSPDWIDYAWDLFYDVWSVAMLFIPGLGEVSIAVDIADLGFMVVDAIMSSRTHTAVGVRAGSGYFTVRDKVYLMNTSGHFELLEGAHVLGDTDTDKDAMTVWNATTKAQAGFIVYDKIFTRDKDDDDPSPVKLYVQFLKNGRFWNPNLPSTQTSVDLNPYRPLSPRSRDDTWSDFRAERVLAVGSRAITALKDGKVYAYRVANKQVQGTPTSYVVRRVKFDDGFATCEPSSSGDLPRYSFATDFLYDETSVLPQVQGGAVFGKVTTYYTGTSGERNSSGCRISYFYARQPDMDGMCPDPWTGCANPLLIGRQYAEAVYDASMDPNPLDPDVVQDIDAVPISHWKEEHYIKSVQVEGRPDATGYYVQTRSRETVNDGQHNKVRWQFNEGNGRINAEVSLETDVRTGKKTQLTTFTTYAFEVYDDVNTVHNLSGVSCIRQTSRDAPPDVPGKSPPDAIDAPPYISQVLSVWTTEATNAAGQPTAVAITKEYAALADDIAVGGGGEPANTAHWYLSNEITARHSTGAVTEYIKDGVTTSCVYDTNGLFTLAVFVNASVEGHQAGYFNFQPEESAEGVWSVGDHEISALSLAAPSTILPDSPSYVIVAAYVKVTNESDRVTIGFKDSEYIRTVGPTTDQGTNGWSPTVAQWQYIEVTAPYSPSLGVPFAEFPGGQSTISSIRFAPVNATVTTQTIDFSQGRVVSTMGTNGLQTRTIRDRRERTTGVVTSDGDVVSLGWKTDASRDGDMFTPSQTMSMITRTDSRYASQLGVGDWDTNMTSTGSAIVQFTPSNTAFSVTVSCGSYWVTSTDSRLTLGRGAQTKGQWDLECDEYYKCFVWFLNNYIWVWVNDTLFARHSDNHAITGDVKVNVATGSISDVCAVLDPLVTSAYTNAFKAKIQTQSLTDDGICMVTAQTIYNGWGSVEIQTKPASSTEWRWSYSPDFAQVGADGVLTGSVATYYERTYSSGDASHAYARTYAERSPRARPVAVTVPGESFQFKERATLIEYGHDDDTTTNRTTIINSVFDKLGTPSVSRQDFGITTTTHTLGATTLTNVEIMEQSGNVVSRSSMCGTLQQITSHQQSFVDSSLPSTVDSPPATFSHASGMTEADVSKYATTTSYDYLGRITQTVNGDNGTGHSLANNRGLTRFVASADDPEITIVHKYDILGRVVESGVLREAWNEGTLKANVETPSYPTSTSYSVHSTFTYDVNAAGSSQYLKGKLVQSTQTDSNGTTVTQVYRYTSHGSVMSTTRTVSSFGDVGHTTTYEYDKMGHVTKTVYPTGNDGQPVLEVVRGYTRNGRLETIGTPSEVDRFAKYEYAFDGKVSRGYMNKQGGGGHHKLTRRVSYNLQGQLVSIQDTGPEGVIFEETLSYIDPTVGYLGGQIAKTTFDGVCGSYSVASVYDGLGRLVTATMSPGPNDEESLISTYTYDIGNNLTTHERNNTEVMQVELGSGTNQVIDDDDVSYTGGQVRSNANVKSVSYDPITGLTTAFTPRSGIAADTQVTLAYGTGLQRVQKTVGTSKRLYCHGIGVSPLVEYTRAAPESPCDTTVYVHGLSGILAIIDGDGTHWVTQDHLGSTRAITDSNHELRGALTYDHFGAVPPAHSSGQRRDESIDDAEHHPNDQSLDVTQFRYLYTGQEYDAESGQYNYKLRLYDPQHGSFLAPDPIGDGHSPYTYVGGDPMNSIDPTGAAPGAVLEMADHAGEDISRAHISDMSSGHALDTLMSFDSKPWTLAADDARASFFGINVHGGSGIPGAKPDVNRGISQIKASRGKYGLMAKKWFNMSDFELRQLGHRIRERPDFDGIGILCLHGGEDGIIEFGNDARRKIKPFRQEPLRYMALRYGYGRIEDVPETKRRIQSTQQELVRRLKLMDCFDQVILDICSVEAMGLNGLASEEMGATRFHWFVGMDGFSNYHDAGAKWAKMKDRHAPPVIKMPGFSGKYKRYREEFWSHS